MRCAAIHRHIENSLDRETEDFELQVSSPGLDLPFGVMEQYYKNEGKKVEVIDNEGTKYTGILKNITAGGFELETEVKVKGKTKEVKDISFNFEQIKSTRVILTIKVIIRGLHQMENVNLIDTFSEFKELKNIDRPTMMSVLEDVFRSMLAKKYGSADNFDIIVNIDKGDFEIWRNRVVVEDDEVN